MSLLLATTAHAEIYKCVVDGKTIFSQQPCAAEAVVVTPKVFTTTSEGQALHDKTQAEENAYYDMAASDFRLMELEQRIKETESQIIYLAHERDRSQNFSKRGELSARIELLKDTRVQLKTEYSAIEAEQRDVARKLYLRSKM
ncbi:MAG: DUF4124 domain-containing protein [Halothiobacillaceae bacterium]|nr:DUF4124 domain-containing protein [Halothiobacillaceae bacterium]